ncbi:MAG: ExeA family protein [Gammaproteobacteria bacterium]
MYTEYFGLREQPFSLTPDPHFLYLSARHREALAHLVFGVEQGGGFVQLTGEVGTGKTTLCRSLLEQLSDRVDAALVLSPRMSAGELLAAVCDELNIPYDSKATSPKPLVDAINQHLLTAHAQGRRTVVIIDEAQNLTPDVLEQVRLLTNLETAKHKLLQVILVGQPELRDLLARSDLRQLAQRITARYHLTPLNLRETAAYIQHRLAVSGAWRSLFTDGAQRRVHRVTGGVPRLINAVCDRALLGAYSQEQQQIDARLVRAAAAQVLGPGVSPGRRSVHRARWLAASGLLVLMVLAAWWLHGHPVRAWRAQAQQVVEHVEAALRGPARPRTAQPAAPAGTGVVRDAAGTRFAQILAQPPSPGEDQAAFVSLFHEWGLHYRALPGDTACERAQGAGLRCLYRSGNWSRLRRYDRPAILALTGPGGYRHQGVLMALTGDQVTLQLGGRALEIPQAVVGRYWYGDYLLLWKPPLGTTLILPGTRGPAVEWLRDHLGQADGTPLPGSEPGFFDDTLKSRLLAFQLHHGLRSTGTADVDTLILLNTLTGNSDLPRLDSTATYASEGPHVVHP